LVLVVFALIFLVPYIWVIFGSFRPEMEVFNKLYPFNFHTLIPQTWTLDNFRDVLGLSEVGREFGLHFGRNIMNSIIVVIYGVLGGLFINIPAAFFFSRISIRGKEVLFWIFMGIMLIPYQTTIVPLYLLMNKLKFSANHFTLVLPYVVNPFLIFLLRQFFSDIPKVLDEAATIDGASRIEILWRVIIPNSIPAIITACILQFQFFWNSFFWPMIYINDPSKQLIQVALQAQNTDIAIYWGRTFAGSVLASLPVVVVFLIAQKYYVRGMAMTGVKS